MLEISTGHKIKPDEVTLDCSKLKLILICNVSSTQENGHEKREQRLREVMNSVNNMED